MNEHESARPCGCDAGANWICKQHSPDSVDIALSQIDAFPPRGMRMSPFADEVLGDCIGCDNYILDAAEAPYCPTCSRLRSEGKAL